MANVLNNRGPVTADTTYVSGKLVARNTTVTLPEVKHVMATIQSALGEHEIPLQGLVEALEATIGKIGVDEGLAAMLTMEAKTYEFRWVQQVTSTDGTSSVEGCKAFIRGIPKVAVPAIEVAPGESVEMEVPLSVSRYQLIVNGKEIVLIDKMAGILSINGVNYATSLDSLL